ncbi:MAG: dihydroorotate dehydrogenase [Ilumatobacteraceae bacterium]
MIGRLRRRSGPTDGAEFDSRVRVDTGVRVGSVGFRSPIMTASGTAGYGRELAPYVDLSAIGAVVTKSLASFEWPGNPAPRLHPTPQGMLNAVGLQGPGVSEWLAHEVPELVESGATVVCSIWGRTVEEYRRAADLLAAAPPEVVAVEVNLSCPNLEGRGGIFAHDAERSAEVVAATAGCGRPRWAKLSPNTDRIVEVAEAVAAAGAEAVTLVNTLLGLVVDPITWRPALGNGGGGLSGRAIHPVAVRAVHDVRRALPDLPIVGAGGVASGWDALEMLLVGADAVQVGTANFADPGATRRIHDELVDLLASRDIRSVADLQRIA